MSQEIINPFKQSKKTDWAKKAQERFKNTKIEVKSKLEKKQKVEKVPEEIGAVIKKIEKDKKNVKRVAKSFKIYPGSISKDFDKRVNKLQVHFDDLNFKKDYVDSGKYIMFLMSLAEKYKLYELYEEVDLNNNLKIKEEKLEKLFK